MEESQPVARVSDAAKAARERRLLCEALRDGQDAMRAGRTTWLPRFERESLPDYDARLAQSFLTNYTAEGVGFAVGQVFSKDVKLGADVPPVIAGWCENVDLRGNNLHVFARERFTDYWWTGCGLWLVDNPLPVEGVIDRSEAAERRPWFAGYPVKDVLAWRYRFRRGKRELEHIRFRDDALVSTDEFGQEVRERIRCYWAPAVSPDGDLVGNVVYSLWERDPNARTAEARKWVEIVPPTPIDEDEIPVVIVGDLDAPPPFAELAFLNLADYQNESVRQNIEKIANTPIPYVAGVNGEDLAKQMLAWSTRTVLALPEGAVPGYWEHSGKCIAELKATIAANRQEMDRRTMRSLREQGGGAVTATSDIITAGRMCAQLQAAALAMKDALENGLRFFGRALNLGDDKGGSVELNRDFFAVSRGADVREWAKLLREQEAISRESLYAAAMRCDAVPDGSTWEEESERIAKEAPVAEPVMDEEGGDDALGERVVDGNAGA